MYRTKVFRYNQKFRKVPKCSAKFQCHQWVKFGDTEHAPIQLHTSHPHGKSRSQMAAAARVARSTFCQGVKSRPEKSQTLTHKGPKKGQPFFQF